MVNIGVSGHRELGNDQAAANAVDIVLKKIKESYRDSQIRVISPLAEGADRLVASRAIEIFSAQLIVPLPFGMSEYMTDFKSASSKTEFEDLMKLAVQVVQIPEEKTREAGYLAAGRYMLDHCDVLIALWDGRSARGIGGTGQIVAEARNQGKPMAWIQIERQESVPQSEPKRDVDQILIHYERFSGINR